MIKHQDVLDFINSKRWLYASEPGSNGKVVQLYFAVDYEYWVVEQQGFSLEEKELYRGYNLKRAVTTFNRLIN